MELTRLVGKYAQNYFLEKKIAKAMAETTHSWKDFGPSVILTPDPSWRAVF